MSNSIENDYMDKMNMLLWEATECGFRAAKPQNTFHDIWLAMVNYLESQGIDRNDYSKGRLGHCLGLQLTELPSIVENEKTILQEGMVLCIEPSLQLPDNKCLVHEECIVITKTGYRLLTIRAPQKYINMKVNFEYNSDSVNIYYPLQQKNEISNETKQFLMEFDNKQSLCKEYHESISDKMTPLFNMNNFEKQMNIKEIIVKDEGQRFGLKSFKGLGSSFAIHMLKNKPSVLCTMTDGNHGKGVAYIAQKLGIRAIIYVPNNMTLARQKAMSDLGAEVIVVNGLYDDAIEEVMSNFEFIIESSKVGVRKPDPKIYKLACEKAKVSPVECLYLDDLGVNLKPAKAMGMRTIKVFSPEQAISELEENLGIQLT